MSEEPLEEDRALLAELDGMVPIIVDERFEDAIARLRSLSAAHRRCEELCAIQEARVGHGVSRAVVSAKSLRAALAPATGAVSKRDGE